MRVFRTRVKMKGNALQQTTDKDIIVFALKGKRGLHCERKSAPTTVSCHRKYSPLPLKRLVCI